MTILSTERLFLREATLNDATFFLELLNTPGWKSNIGNFKIKTEEEAKTYLNRVIIKSYKENGFGLWIMETRPEQKAIGICGLVDRDDLQDIDLGFAVLPFFEGKGYAFEAASKVLEHGLNKLQREKVVAITSPNNKRSINLLTKLGMSFSDNIEYGEQNEPLMLFEISRDVTP